MSKSKKTNPIEVARALSDIRAVLDSSDLSDKNKKLLQNAHKTFIKAYLFNKGDIWSDIEPVSDYTSYTDAIRKHLLKHGKITSLEAIVFYGCTRIAEFIRRLRNDESFSERYIILTSAKSKVKHGKGVYATYKLIKIESENGQKTLSC